MDGITLVVFDLAGTTVEDDGQVPGAFREALAEYGVEVTPPQLDAVRGSSKRQAALGLVPEGAERERVAEAVYLSFRERLARRYAARGVRPVEGAARVFAWLRGRGVRVALNTGFDRETTATLLGALGWDAGGVADAVVCADDVARGRPAPYMIFRAMEAVGTLGVREVMNVGDTALDLRAGHNAGVRRNVGVLSGAHDRPTLEGAPHTHLLASVADLPGLWDEAGRD